VLEAESGGGKSRLLDETGRLAARAAVPVLKGQGVQQSGSRPFALVQGSGPTSSGCCPPTLPAAGADRGAGGGDTDRGSALPQLAGLLAGQGGEPDEGPSSSASSAASTPCSACWPP
jgi:hypothetical protein